MSEVQKLDRQSVNADLARRIGWQEFPYLVTSLGRPEGKRVFCPPGQPVHVSTYEDAPDFFTDRNAAVELVSWIYKQDIRLRIKFGQALDALLWADRDHKAWNERFEYLLAKPEQITLAACAALGLAVE
jgi:hypothetical protein